MKLFIKILCGISIWFSAVVSLSAVGTKITEKNFPDSFLRLYVKDKYDKNQDGILSDSEKNQVKIIDVGEASDYQLEYEYPPPYTMKGIEVFPNLTELDCTGCSLDKIDVSKFKKLRRLYCKSNEIKKLDVSKNKKLEELNCSNNQLSTLNLRENVNLNTLFCDGNKLKAVNVTKNRKLETLSVSNNKIKKLSLRRLIKLEKLYCDQNSINKLDVTQNRKLNLLNCCDNKLKKLNLSKNGNLDYLACSRNRLTRLNLKRNHLLQYLYCRRNCMILGNLKIGRTQLLDCLISPQKQTIRVKKFGKRYYIPLGGVKRTNEITNLSAGTVTERGIRLQGKKLPKKVTYEYNMFTDGEEKTEVEIKVKKKGKKKNK